MFLLQFWSFLAERMMLTDGSKSAMLFDLERKER